MIWRVTTAAVVASAGLVLSPGIGTASAESPACLAHLAEHPGTTAAADRRYHLNHSQASPCSEADAQGSDSSGSSHNDDRRDNRSGDDSSDDSKSRFCRHHWYC